ncbi:MAG TPA: non-homologous end-joining DNA ligase, partial [Gemmatimonadales bacterium]|nr:non-homologous end-joining DNA ligase [Gemmatimonadales bacterium]
MGAKRKAGPDPLRTYREKRSLDRTPEPGARAAPAAVPGGGLFVVHMHAARRLHWDLRLEMEGVLRSWAVPKGPSPNPADKRLAVHVEDHPLEYGDFEGLIPEGNYGAGAVIVWDRGRWVPLEDPVAGMEKGKLLFELWGYKLRGKWTLVKLKKGEKEWLLIKEKDAYVAADGALPPESVLSGLTVEELRAGPGRAAPVAKELARWKAPRRAVALDEAEPMLAEPREQPFSKPGWMFELKLDGYRVRAGREHGEVRLVTRNGNDIAPAFPELARAVAALPYEGVILDGELVVPDGAGRPSFQRLQNRARVSRALDIRRAAVETPAELYVFDLLAFAGWDLRPLALEKRKAVLQQILPRLGPLKYVEHFATDGTGLYEQVVKLGLEGIVAKKADAPYRPGRSPNWLKIRADRTDDFVVVGFTRPKGSRSGFGALDLGAFAEGTLVYVGRVGSGFTATELQEVSAALEKSARPTPAFSGPVPQDPGHTWVEPTLVVEVRYKEWTDEALLRQPVFVRFRDDKPITECLKPSGARGGRGSEDHDPEPPAVRPASSVTPREVKFSNLDKVFWPDERYTKGD